MELSVFLPILAAFFIVTISPGPANIAVATIAMSAGRRSGVLFGLGLAFGLAFWGLVAATGLGAVLQASEIALIFLKLFGGIYLLWLAYQSARSAKGPDKVVQRGAHDGKWFMRGLLSNLSNPKAVVAWMAALSMGMGHESGLMELSVVILICILLGFLNYLGHAFAFSFKGVMHTYQKGRRWIDSAVAVLFSMAGFGLIRSAMSR